MAKANEVAWSGGIVIVDDPKFPTPEHFKASGKADNPHRKVLNAATGKGTYAMGWIDLTNVAHCAAEIRKAFPADVIDELLVDGFASLQNGRNADHIGRQVRDIIQNGGDIVAETGAEFLGFFAALPKGVIAPPKATALSAKEKRAALAELDAKVASGDMTPAEAWEAGKAFR